MINFRSNSSRVSSDVCDLATPSGKNKDYKKQKAVRLAAVREQMVFQQPL